MYDSERGVSRRGLALLGAGLAAAAAVPATAQKSASALTGGDWMAQVKAQHAEIDRLFGAVRSARDSAGRGAALKQLATVLTGHSIAEEVALYPHIAMHMDKGDAQKAYAEQQEAKILLATLDSMPDKMSPKFTTTFDTLQAAIKAHVGEEEGRWYPELMKRAPAAMQTKMTADFRREYTRYVA